MGSEMVQTIREAKITETIGNGVQSVKDKLTDPKLQEDIRETVQTGKNRLYLSVKSRIGWSWISGAATSLWNVARDTANSIAAEFMEAETSPTDETGSGSIPPSKSSGDFLS